jgi:D-alanyl-D-alanine-carboxypeptidase/D-alanyl-D-alanine-endopeptidase
MVKKRFGGPALILAASVTCLLAADLSELRSLLINRTEEAHKAGGIVLGLAGPEGETFLAAGATAPGGTAEPGPDTVYEIGSITKVFTCLVLADMAVRGEAMLDDPVAKFLPATVKVPSRGGREITLLDLATQVSGLPRLPGNLKPADMLNPYADYGPAQLYEFLSGYTLTRDIDAAYEYSNLGVGLLGYALSLKAGTSYEELVRRRVLEPLGMTDTGIALSPSQRARLAVGTDPELKPVKNWDFEVLAGAGALRSTARDMLKFLTAAMGLRETPLRRAFDLMLTKVRPTGTPDLEIGLGWHVWTKYGTRIIWHNGGTGGYRSFAGYDPAKKTGVVVLCGTSFSVDDLGLHALEAHWPVGHFRPSVARKEIAVGEKILDAYTGEYELKPGLSIIITKNGARLFLRVTGQDAFELAASSPTEFFIKSPDVQVTFVRDEAGAVTRLLLFQNGFEQKAVKIK